MVISAHPTFRIAACDLNGQMRGKRVPATHAGKLDKGGLKMPLSALNVDIWGADIDDSPLVFATGDQDGVLVPTDRGPVPMPWLDHPSSLVPMTMTHDGTRPYRGDPRQALSEVLDRYGARGWQVVAATEMEFSLVDDSGDTLAPPRDPRTGRRLFGADILAVTELDAFDRFFTELYEGCDAMGLALESIINEAGLGQFEVTLSHQDALRAADDAWLFKVLARGMARKHGMAATFMAKPYPDDAGNGMHVHFSVCDSDGQNVFDNGADDGSDTLRAAVAGCLSGLRPSTLIFAPHGPSYDRFAPGAHAPTSVCWAYENRTAALRIPNGPAKARRIEHRVSGGDVNPYLALAAILGAAIEGVEERLVAPAPITGNAYEFDLPQLEASWESALSAFETDAFIARCLPACVIENLVLTKRQELQRLTTFAPEKRWEIYLERV